MNYPITLLPLESFREEMSLHPFHFWQFADTNLLAVQSACNGLVKQYAWQKTDAVGRYEILEAIARAEDMLREWLGYSVAPHYIEETHPFPRYYDPRQGYAASVGSDGRWLSVTLDEGYIANVGIESLTLIGNTNVTFSDQDGDTIEDTFTASIATTVTDASQIAVYFTANDRLDSEAVSERWRIRPVQVVISGGTATIRGRKWLLAKPVKYEGVATDRLDPATSSNLVSQVAIYQRKTSGDGTTAATAQGVLEWETEPTGWILGCCDVTTTPSDSSGDPAAIAQAVARVGIRNARLGIVHPAEAVRDATSGIWTASGWGNCSPPDKVIVRYLAGWPLESTGGWYQMDKRWRTVVARLAAAELSRPICACEAANKAIYHWQFDLARTSGANDEAYGAISAEDLSNPFGTRRGHVAAWKQVRHEQQLRGVLG